MVACRQCGKTWEGVRPQPLLVNGLCLACRRRIEAAEQAAAEAWCEHCGFRPATTVVHRGLCPDCRASYRHGLALWLHDLLWKPQGAAANRRPQPQSYWGRIGVYIFGGAALSGLLGSCLIAPSEAPVGDPAGDPALIILWAMVLGSGAGVGCIVGAFVVPDRPEERQRRPEEQHQPVLPDTRPPIEPRPYTAPSPARTNHRAKGVTRPGMSTLERPSKQLPPGSSRAAEKWPPPPRVRQHRKG